MRCILVMLCNCHWCHCHMMLIAASMAPFDSLWQNDRNEVQHEFLIMYCHWHCHRKHVILIVLSMAPLHLLGQDDWNEVQHDFSGHVIGTNVGIMWLHHHCQKNHYIPCINTIKIRSNMTFLSYDTITIGIMIPLVLVSHEVNSIINGIITFFSSRW